MRERGQERSRRRKKKEERGEKREGIGGKRKGESEGNYMILYQLYIECTFLSCNQLIKLLYMYSAV